MENTSILDGIRIACKFLKVKKGKSQKKVVEALNQKKNKMNSGDSDFTEQILSSYKNAKIYSNGINEGKAWQIFKVLEKYLLEDLNCYWDDSVKDYVSLDEITLQRNSFRLEALIDSWEAFSWDSEASDNDNQIGYVYSFKLKIESANKVYCSTEGVTFKDGRMYLIGTDKICIELSNSARKVFLILHIGSDEAEDIQKKNQYTMAYVDSGLYTVRAGLVIIKRSDKDYPDIECARKPVDDIKSLIPDIEKILSEKQLIITE